MVLVKQINSSQDLENYFNKTDSFMLFIYANWCGHCKAMKPDMEKFKKEASSKPQNILIGFIEDAAVKADPRINEVLTKYNINPEGYPTIVYGKKNEELNELKGERDLYNFNKILNELCKGITTKQSGGRRRRIKRKSRKTAKKRKGKRRRKTAKKGGLKLKNIFRHKKKPDSSLFKMGDFKTGEETINPFLAGQRAQAYEEAAKANNKSWSQDQKVVKRKKKESKRETKEKSKHLGHEYKQRYKPLAAPQRKTFLPAPPKGGRNKTRKRKRRKRRKRNNTKKRKSRN